MPPQSSSQSVRRFGREVRVMASEAGSWHRAYRAAGPGHPPDARRRTLRSPWAARWSAPASGRILGDPARAPIGSPQVVEEGLPMPVITAEGLVKIYAAARTRFVRSTGWTSTSRKGPSSDSSARTVRARRPRSGSSRRCSSPMRAVRPSPGSTSSNRQTSSARSSACPASSPPSTRTSPDARTCGCSVASTSSAPPRPRNEPASCSTSSTSRTLAIASSRRIRVACAAASTSASALIGRPRLALPG